MDIHVRIPGVKYYRSRHGRWYAYDRKTGTRINAEPGTEAFQSALDRIRKKTPAAAAVVPGSLGALIAGYKGSTEFLTLAARTRKDYQDVFDYLQPLETDLLADIKGTWVAAVRDAAFKAKKRRFANYVKTVLSLLFGWAVSREIMEYNPAAKVKKIRRPKDSPNANRPWTRAELRVVMAASPFETALAVGLAVCTALREGDVVHWPWSGYQDGKIQGREHKAGQPIWMPAHPLLQELIDEQRRRQLTRAANGAGNNVLPLSLTSEHPIVTGQRGRPLTEAGLRTNFFKVIRALKREGKVAPGLTFHGLRSTTVVMLVEAGCDDATIQAVTGQSLAMVVHYRRQVNGKKLAARAIERLDFDEESEAD